MSRICKHCGSIEHTSFACFKKPRKPIARTQKPLKRTPLKKIGRITKRWLEVRADYLDQHPSPYFCYICGCILSRETLEIDHIQSRSRHPELRFDLNNLAVVCHTCNVDKASMSLKDYLSRRKTA